MGAELMKTIDLAGPEGNAFALCGIALSWRRQIGLSETLNLDKCDSYEAVLNRFDELFKDRIDYQFINDPRDPTTMEDDS
jgi:hypothetical protein